MQDHDWLDCPKIPNPRSKKRRDGGINPGHGERFLLAGVPLLLLLLLLAGCADRDIRVESPALLAPKVPPLDASLAQRCEVPKLAAGTNAKAALGRNRTALKTCARRHDLTVKWIDGVR